MVMGHHKKVQPQSRTTCYIVSGRYVVKRGVRQGDPYSPKLFTAVIEEL